MEGVEYGTAALYTKGFQHSKGSEVICTQHLTQGYWDVTKPGSERRKGRGEAEKGKGEEEKEKFPEMELRRVNKRVRKRLQERVKRMVKGVI